jgi:hypothetical protein
MNTETVYTCEKINEICEEVERQWEYHLLARAAFPSSLMEVLSEYESGKFYAEHGVQLKVSVPVSLSPIMQRGLEGIAHWLNQNYIIRLYGILDEYKIIKAWKQSESQDKDDPCIEILYLLRPKVGAHSRGYRNPKKSDVQKVTRLIQKHLDSSVEDESVRHFLLAIDTVLYNLKEHCKDFVRSRKGKPIPT